MSVDDASVSNDICASQDLDLVCQNPRGQISSGDEHGDFYPGCLDLNTASNVTEFPTLPEYPRDEESCSDEAFATFYKMGDKSELDNEQDLGDGAIFKWSVKENVGAGSIIVGSSSTMGFLATSPLVLVRREDKRLVCMVPPSLWPYPVMTTMLPRDLCSAKTKSTSKSM
mmetsp:Transcript_9119/g.16521  ORF Transcript_9119/g.16521 Transcript_9119/m.16521 type:complete len:170 (-) Transcript_9119:473-982(-)